MGRISDGWDAAATKGNFHALEVRALPDEPLANRQQTRALASNCIEAHCNRRRLHASTDRRRTEALEIQAVA